MRAASPLALGNDVVAVGNGLVLLAFAVLLGPLNVVEGVDDLYRRVHFQELEVGDEHPGAV